MSAEANAAAARRILDEAFNAGRFDVLDEVCAPGCVSHDPAEEADVVGIDAHKTRIRQYRAAMPDMHITVEDLIPAGDVVVTRWRVSGTNDGELAGMPPTHRHVEVTGTTIDRFDDQGRIAESWDQWDNAGFMRQLGITPEAAHATR